MKRGRIAAALALAALASQAVAQSVPAPAEPGRLAGRAVAPVGAGYQPQDRDERGMWMQAEEAERELKRSTFVMRDAAINAYLRDVLCRIESGCADIRTYLVREATFNASMAPNGMMIVHSGLLMRMRDEAQLAAVLGHEVAHYRYRHVLLGFRDARSKTSAMAWLAMAGIGLIANFGIAGDLFRFSREMEAQADAESVPMLANAGYDTSRAGAIWQQIRDEQDATAAARGTKSRKDKDRSIWASHPPSAERLAALAALATRIPGGKDTAADRYRATIRPLWPQLIDDEIKRNDFGGTEFLLTNLAQGNWTADLLYARGELYRTRGRPEDLTAAIGFYRQALAADAGRAEAYRGLGLAQLRAGQGEDGRQALRRYLELRPQAGDAPMLTALAKG
ncbi:M48 family metallopeptidase [Sphingomonas sp.]|uniref:M48 family metallopeptidase n=1 Tax=Sphingomonas sp. TaxID=28214 RepID=UPI001D867A8F|nr:M48 family metalloprotease [Sphingomonas sp.]MBX9796655.1 M48 family metalloprotease [Sphingomonas sp.]